VLLVGAVTALVAALFLSAPQSLTEVEGLSMIVIGFHSLALPISALISFLVAGAAWLPGASAEFARWVSASPDCSWAHSWSSSGTGFSEFAE
jgi:hypothetical protein